MKAGAMPPSASICTIGADDGWASHPPFPSLGKGRGGEATQFTKDVKAFMGVHALMSTKNTKNAKTKGVKAQANRCLLGTQSTKTRRQR